MSYVRFLLCYLVRVCTRILDLPLGDGLPEENSLFKFGPSTIAHYTSDTTLDQKKAKTDAGNSTNYRSVGILLFIRDG